MQNARVTEIPTCKQIAKQQVPIYTTTYALAILMSFRFLFIYFFKYTFVFSAFYEYIYTHTFVGMNT